MRPESVLVLYCPTGGGHRAAAFAIAERAAARGVRAQTVDALALAPPWFARAYVDAHLAGSAFAPALYGGAFHLSNHRASVDGPLRGPFDRCLGAKLIRLVERAEPTAVVATHFYPLAVLAGRVRAPVVGVVTDYSAHAVWAEPGIDAYCVAPGPARADLVRHGVPEGAIRTTGIPVRSAFGHVPPAARGPASPLRVLVTSGAFGVGPIGRILRSFARVPDIALTVVCGKNEDLVRRATHLCESYGLDARVVGFESDMPARFAEAHVVVGKPGGLTASECLAAGRPLVMVGAVPGQETHNQAFLAECDAGVVARPEQVGTTIAALEAVGALEPMARRAREIGRPWAADRVLETALDCAA